jgi:SpoVK/Ycf46/Vps4 family AAA+-type ATPase
MLRLWQEAMDHVKRVNARLERIKRMNAKADMKERWVRERFGDDEKSEVEVVEPTATSPELVGVMSELDALIGLRSVKAMVRGLVASHRVAQKRVAAGLPVVETRPHLVFSGNPGTGKTTVARLIGRIYKSLGMLSKGHVVEVGRADLIGMYIGHTAVRTREVCKKALGGVLFIDEAYSLNVEGRDFGDEVIETLLTFMEEHRGDIVVVVAGYPAEMDNFLNSNTGLRSRFGTTINFEDLSAQELMDTFDGLLLAQQYEVTPIARCAIRQHFRNARTEGAGGNARMVRNVFEEIVTQHAMSLVGLDEPSIAQLRRITALAIPSSWDVDAMMLLEGLPPIVVGE